MCTPLGRHKSATILDGVGSSFGLDETTKRVLDIVTATMGIAVKVGSRGPIFVRETKYRYDNRAIKVLKFRVVARTNARVAQLGQILNQTGIDELPQLFDVLRGERSIFGRRNIPRWPASLF
jgi:lipopolysaccharide/colanic/teichoic acid biosynthesis glycosyltransferase